MYGFIHIKANQPQNWVNIYSQFTHESFFKKNSKINFDSGHTQRLCIKKFGSIKFQKQMNQQVSTTNSYTSYECATSISE